MTLFSTPSLAVVDPTCGMTIDPDAAVATRMVAGETHFFAPTLCAAV